STCNNFYTSQAEGGLLGQHITASDVHVYDPNAGNGALLFAETTALTPGFFRRSRYRERDIDGDEEDEDEDEEEDQGVIVEAHEIEAQVEDPHAHREDAGTLAEQLLLTSVADLVMNDVLLSKELRKEVEPLWNREDELRYNEYGRPGSGRWDR
ncbi:unnamed protein product, partial [Amoebophrya sp. A25]